MTYEEALAVATANNEIDENQTFLIDKNLRTVTIPDGFVLGVFNDKNVQIVPFAMPRYYNGIDMSTFAIQVNYVNSAGDGDIYLVFDQDVQEDLILFNWVVDRTAFATSGRTGFVVCMKEDDEYGYVAREFNTTLAYAPVLEGLEIENPIDEQTALDILTQIQRAAERADIAAQQAEDSAAQASTDANTASDAASSATSSAATATAAQQSASASATSATNAETNALAYRNAAAASAAEAAAVVTDIEDVLTFPNALVVESATSEDIVTIEDGADDIPMTSVLATMNPIQDLNGYDKPWPGGGGKNLLNNTAQTTTENGITWTVNSDGTVTANGTATADAQFRIDISATDLPRETNLYFSGCPSGGSSSKYNLYVWDVDANAMAKKWNNITSVDNDTGASANNELYLVSGHSCRVICRVMSGQTVSNLVFSPMIRLASVTDGTYAPYSNICPISGRTGMTVTRAGKNLFKIAPFSKTTNGCTLSCDDSGEFTITGTPTAVVTFSVPFNFSLPGTYTISTTPQFAVATEGCRAYMKSRSSSSGSFEYPTFSSTPITRTFTDGVINGISVEIKMTFSGTLKFGIQIENGSVATAYEPYVGQTYLITWESAGTVYGGTLDVVSGVLTVTHKYRLLNDPDQWIKAVNPNTINYQYNTPFRDRKIFADSFLGLSCSYYRVNKSLPNDTARWAGAISYNFGMKTTSITLEDIKTAATNNEIEICYPLATPQTYQLTPTEVRTILGGNNVYTDAGDVSVEYRADLKMYIDKKIAEAIA